VTTQLIHCSYHKCLTKYYVRVMVWMYNRIFRFSKGYRHFDSRIDQFYEDLNKYRVASINNRALDLERIGDCRVSRFIRDPRDMVVSGYFYHKRGAEKWCNRRGLTEEYLGGLNGGVPEQMGEEQSFSEYLQGLSQEDGLIAEIEFRKYHFESMLGWPTDDPRVKLFRYEDMMGNEEQVFAEMFSFYELSWVERKLGLMLARRFSARGRGRLKEHIRNPKANQWKEYFTPKVSDYFSRHHKAVLDKYGYE